MITRRHWWHAARSWIWILASFVFSTAASAAVDATWLRGQQNADGSFGAPGSSVATPFQSTAETLVVLQQLGLTGDPAYASGLAYLNNDPDTGTESLSRRLLAVTGAGGDATSLVSALLAHRNADNGFADTAGYSSSTLDTAFALHAATVTSAIPGTELPPVILHLIKRQQGDGGWTDGDNTSSVYLTSLAMQALVFYRNQYAEVKTAMSAGEQFLISQRGANGLWAEPHDSALALIALAQSMVDASLLESSFTALANARSANGSWNDDVYTTALALRAQFLYDLRKSPAVSSSAAVSGYVLRAGTGEPVAGAEVQLTGGVNLTVVTNASGYYLIPGLAAGSYTVSASRAGFTTASTAATVAAGQTAVASTLLLDIAPTTALVRGQVFNGSDLTALTGVGVELLGLNSYSTQTSSQGAFELRAVAAGDYTIRFSKTGYQTVSGAVTVVGGQILSVQQPMMADGAFLDNQPGTINGRVLDAKTGLPVVGAMFDLGGYSATTDANGGFAIASVPRGNYDAQLSAGGYQAQRYAVNYPAGSSGNLGTLNLYPATADTAPTTVTVLGIVTDAVSGLPIAGATVSVTGTGLSAQSAADGTFTLSGIGSTAFDLAVSAPAYLGANVSVQTSGFGEVHAGLQLTPESAAATRTSLHGVIRDLVSGAPVAGATIEVVNTALTATSLADGSYSLDGITTLDFTISVSASGYGTDTRSLQIATHGSYVLDIPLAASAGLAFEVGAVMPRQASAGSNAEIVFDVTVKNLMSIDRSALVVGEIIDAAGKAIAVVEPFTQGTQTPASSFDFTADESKALTLSWNTAQNAPGTYRVLVRVIEPGSITRAVPWGTVLAENSGYAQITGSASISGAMLLLPPLTQAGSSNPVLLSARIQNSGNTPLDAGDYRLTITHPDTGATLFSTVVTGSPLAVSESMNQDFGSWVPTSAGNLNVVIESLLAGVSGRIEGRLYVGDRATGVLSVNKNVVPEGTQTVRGNLHVEGVDTTQGTVSDPLYALVKDAVSRGGVYTGREAVAWDRRSTCLGCHIQTQSLVGMASSLDRADVSLEQTKFLYNSVASSQQQNGGLYISHPQHTKVQTALGLWSLTSWPDKTVSFRTKYRAAKHLFDRKTRDGYSTYWLSDHAFTGWWQPVQAMTALTISGFADVLRSSTQIDLSKVKNYSQSDGPYLGANNDPTDIKAGPDGMLYVLVYNTAVGKGSVLRWNPADNTMTTVVADTGTVRHGLAVAADGTLFVSGYQKILRINTDGTQQVLRQTTAAQYFVGMAIGADGKLYVADHGNHRILRMNLDGTGQEVFASGAMFSNPYGLAFDANNNLIVANYSAKNMLRVAPDGTTTLYADGLAYGPLMLAMDNNGDAIVSTNILGADSQTTPEGLLRITADGIIEPIDHAAKYFGVVNHNGTILFTDRTARKIRQLSYTNFNPSVLDELRNEVPRSAKWVLAQYRDNTSDNIVHSQRLNILAEARSVITDAQLQTDIDVAIPYIANVLKARQRADGGWGRYYGWGSDSMVTALVGLALEHTNPSADDPMVRKAITYLLNRQAADGSWKSENGLLGTRLAATSLVMAYMPRALDRLGGMDLDIHMTVRDNVVLSNPTVMPDTVTTLPSGELDYLWKLKGVTSKGQNVDFDVTLNNLQLNESRPVASAAYLEFKNSFVNSTERLDLEIPAVRAASEMAVGVSVDKSVYGANEPMSIAPVVSNGGPTTASGNVTLTVRAAGDTSTSIASLPPIPVTDLASGQQAILSADWNTGGTYVGGYEVLAVLMDLQGRELSRAVTPFTIVALGASVTTSIATDKPVYGGWDTVQISGRVINVAQNAILPPSLVDIIVRNPSGIEVYRSRAPLSELAPGALRTLPFTMGLVDALTGNYTVELQLLNAFNHDLLHSSQTSFQVEWKAVQALSGTVVAAPQRVAWGVPTQCTFTTSNRSATDLSNLGLTYRLINMETGTVVSDEIQSLAVLAAGMSDQHVRTIDTGSLSLGGYACQLIADVAGEQRVLAFSGFHVYDPVKMDAQIKLGTKGRVLVLVDPSTGGGGNCGDLKQVGLRASFADLPANAVIEVSVLDTSGKVTERETLSLATMTGPVNEQPGSEGADLTVTEFTATSLGVLLSEYHASKGSVPNKHSVVADVTVDGNVLTSLSSGPIQTSCGSRPAIGDNYGNFTVERSITAFNTSEDPFGPETAPDLVNQRAYIEQLLAIYGWSYTIVDNAEDFRLKLNGGEYSIYLLLNEYEKLDETTQKVLREAVFRGDGLVVASGHDARNTHHPKLTEALGLRPEGVFSDVAGVDSLSTTSPLAWPAGGTDLTVLTKVGRLALQGAEAVAAYRQPSVPSANLAAVTQQSYGAGRTVTIGFDWAAEATAQLNFENYLAQLLIKGLEHVSPTAADTLAGHVVPLTVTVQNQGITALTRVRLALPAGATLIDAGLAKVQGANLTWDFTLPEGQSADLDFWVKLPEVAGPLIFNGEVTAVNPSGKYHVYATPSLTVDAASAIAVESVQLSIDQLVAAGIGEANALNRAQNALARAQAAWPVDPATALFEGLKAADALQEAGTALEVALTRRILDHWLWTVARQVP